MIINIDRRSFLGGLAAAAALPLIPRPLAAAVAPFKRLFLPVSSGMVGGLTLTAGDMVSITLGLSDDGDAPFIEGAVARLFARDGTEIGQARKVDVVGRSVTFIADRLCEAMPGVTLDVPTERFDAIAARLKGGGADVE